MNEAALPAGSTDTLRLPRAACLALCQDLPRAVDLDSSMCIVERVRQQLLGDGLLTVSLNASLLGQDPDGDSGNGDARIIELERIWSSNPAVYPVSGRKRKAMTPWTNQLLCRGEVFIGEGETALAQVFDDHALIASLGLRAVVNVPLLDDRGACFATFNVLGTGPLWRPDEVLLVRLLATLAAPAVRRAATAPGAVAHHELPVPSVG
jgi:hypothetical protein